MNSLEQQNNSNWHLLHYSKQLARWPTFAQTMLANEPMAPQQNALETYQMGPKKYLNVSNWAQNLLARLDEKNKFQLELSQTNGKKSLAPKNFDRLAQLSCDSGEMILRLNFSEPFRGIVYPDQNRLSPCRFFGDGHHNYELRLPLKGCGTRQVSATSFLKTFARLLCLAASGANGAHSLAPLTPSIGRLNCAQIALEETMSKRKGARQHCTQTSDLSAHVPAQFAQSRQFIVAQKRCRPASRAAKIESSFELWS